MLRAACSCPGSRTCTALGNRCRACTTRVGLVAFAAAEPSAARRTGSRSTRAAAASTPSWTYARPHSGTCASKTLATEHTIRPDAARMTPPSILFRLRPRSARARSLHARPTARATGCGASHPPCARRFRPPSRCPGERARARRSGDRTGRFRGEPAPRRLAPPGSRRVEAPAPARGTVPQRRVPQRSVPSRRAAARSATIRVERTACTPRARRAATRPALPPRNESNTPRSIVATIPPPEHRPADLGHARNSGRSRRVDPTRGMVGGQRRRQ